MLARTARASVGRCLIVAPRSRLNLYFFVDAVFTRFYRHRSLKAASSRDTNSRQRVEQRYLRWDARCARPCRAPRSDVPPPSPVPAPPSPLPQSSPVFPISLFNKHDRPGEATDPACSARKKDPVGRSPNTGGRRRCCPPESPVIPRPPLFGWLPLWTPSRIPTRGGLLEEERGYRPT